MLRKQKQSAFQQLLACMLFLIGNAWLPYAWHSRLANQWFAGDETMQTKLANGMEHWMDKGLDRDTFTTGSKQFDGEWLYGTYVMTAMGYGQLATQQPARKKYYLAQMEHAIDQVLSDRVRKFDVERWGSDPLETLELDEGHAAYLGYLNLAMGFHRKLDPESKFTTLNNHISEALRRRIEASPSMLLESYPYETYPVDNCAVIASVALNSRIRWKENDDLPNRWVIRCKSDYVDSDSGLLFQAIDGRTGQPLDFPRGSGTTLGLYFLSFMDVDLSADLYKAVKRELAGKICGFGLVREYPKSTRGGKGDIDSGPIVFGYGLSPTGFAIGGARIHGDGGYFRHLYATANAAGAPLQTQERINFVTGASLGDAILFAMLTAQPGGIGGSVQ